MPLREFWINVHFAAGVKNSRWIVDSPKLDITNIERSLGESDNWLTSKSVEGYDENDFSFLPETGRQWLKEQVTRFREVAATVPFASPATEEQVLQALPVFLGIIAFLEFDRFGDPDAYRIGKQIENLIEVRRPVQLRELLFQAGKDHGGDDAIWIWAILDDEAAEERVFPIITHDIRKLLKAAVRRIATEILAYVYFRTISEQEIMAEAVAR